MATAQELKQFGGDAIAEVAALVQSANKTDVLKVSGEREGVYFLVGPDGKATKHVADPSWHREQLETPGELAAFVDSEKGDRSVVFLNEKQVIFVKDLADRRDIATCTLIETPQIQWLKQCSGKQLQQADFVRLLRITFRGALGPDSGLVALIRNLKFSTAADGGANIQHARESIGRSVMAEVRGESAIPEEVTLRVPVFENHPFIAPVSCAIEVFPHEQAFRLTPFPLQVRMAVDAALANIEELFGVDAMPQVFRGQP